MLSSTQLLRTDFREVEKDTEEISKLLARGGQYNSSLGAKEQLCVAACRVCTIPALGRDKVSLGQGR